MSEASQPRDLKTNPSQKHHPTSSKSPFPMINTRKTSPRSDFMSPRHHNTDPEHTIVASQIAHWHYCNCDQIRPHQQEEYENHITSHPDENLQVPSRTDSSLRIVKFLLPGTHLSIWIIIPSQRLELNHQVLHNHFPPGTQDGSTSIKYHT